MAKKPDDGALMTLRELSGYLHLDEQTVTKLVSTGKLPAIQFDRQWRFKRAAVDAWIADQLIGDDENFVDVPDGMQLPLEDLLPDSAIIATLKSTSALGVVEELAARAYSSKWLSDKPWFVGAVVERETLSSTAMEGGVAFLHTRARDKGKIVRPFVVVGRSWQGIHFGAPDGEPTHLFFLLGLKYDKLHLPILGRLARCMRNPATIARLRALSSPDQIRALLLKEDAQVRSGLAPSIDEAFKPKLDRSMRLKTIRRLQEARTDAVTAATKPARTRKPRVKKTDAVGKPAKAAAKPVVKPAAAPQVTPPAVLPKKPKA